MGCINSKFLTKPNSKIICPKRELADKEPALNIPEEPKCQDHSYELDEFLPNSVRSQINLAPSPKAKMISVWAQNKNTRDKTFALPPLPGKNLLKNLSFSNGNTPVSRNLLDRVGTYKPNTCGGFPKLAKTNSLLSIPLRKVDDTPTANSEAVSRGSSPWPAFSSIKGSERLSDLTFRPEFALINNPHHPIKPVQKSSSVQRSNTIIKRRETAGKLIINQYTLTTLIGNGNYAKIYKATDSSGQEVAIKIYNKRLMKSRWIGKGKTYLPQIYSEVNIMEQLSHPNIITLLEVIDRPDSNKIYLVLEYMDKGSLYENSPVPENQAKDFFIQILTALEYLHETLHIVHQDIKPQNILINSKGQIKLCDFGSASFINENKAFNHFTGTYAFMAPELHGGQYKIQGPAIDIWALGITLYYMLLGRTPYKSRKSVDLSEEVRQTEIRIPQNFSEALKKILFRVFQKNPEQRATLEELRTCEWVRTSLA